MTDTIWYVIVVLVFIAVGGMLVLNEHPVVFGITVAVFAAAGIVLLLLSSLFTL